MLPKSLLQKIESLLTRLWLNQSEQKIYMTGLFSGSLTIQQLAEKSWIKRVTAHSIVSALMEMGLFQETMRGKKRLVHPSPPEAIEHLLEKKQFELDQLSSQYNSTLNIFSKIQNLSENFPKVRMLQWTEWITTTLLEQAKDKHDVYVLNDAHSLNNLVEEKTLHRSYTKRTSLGIKTRMVFPEWFTDFWHLSWDDDVNIHIKTLAPELITTWWVEIRWNKVALHCRKEWFVTSTIMENKETAALIMCMFNALRHQAVDYQGSFVLV